MPNKYKTKEQYKEAIAASSNKEEGATNFKGLLKSYFKQSS
jgi:hypothetical protein